jgi:hypothetical protein
VDWPLPFAPSAPAPAQQREEEEAVADDKRVAFWIDLLRHDATPSDMALRVDPIAARAFIKSAVKNSSLQGLDMCGCQLQDDVGVEVRVPAARARESGATDRSACGLHVQELCGCARAGTNSKEW